MSESPPGLKRQDLRQAQGLEYLRGAAALLLSPQKSRTTSNENNGGLEFSASPEQARDIQLGPLDDEGMRLLELMALRNRAGSLPPHLENERQELIRYLDGDRSAIKNKVLREAEGMGIQPQAALRRLESAWEKEDNQRAAGLRHRDARPTPKGTIISKIFEGITPEAYKLAELLRKYDAKPYKASLGHALKKQRQLVNESMGDIPGDWKLYEGKVNPGHKEGVVKKVGYGDFMVQQFSAGKTIVDIGEQRRKPLRRMADSVGKLASRALVSTPTTAAYGSHMPQAGPLPPPGMPTSDAVGSILSMDPSRLLSMSDEEIEKNFPDEADRNYAWYAQSWIEAKNSDGAETPINPEDYRRSMLSRLGRWGVRGSGGRSRAT